MNYGWTVRVIWDESKSRTNRKKHGVSFEEASALFYGGDDYLEIFDDAPSDDEDRFIPSGVSRGASFSVCTRSVMRTRFVSLAPVGRRGMRWNSIGVTPKEVRHDRHS
jgi:uncharacterized protein